MADEFSDARGKLDSERIEEAAAARAQRRAEEAARAAEEAARVARRAEHARDLAEVRRHLDEERVSRELQRQAMLAERARAEAEQSAVDQAQAQTEAQRSQRQEAVQARKDARARLEADAARVALERAALDAADAAEAEPDAVDSAAAERDELNRRAVAELEAEQARAAADHQALAVAMQRELDEIDQRLEERARARETPPPPSQRGEVVHAPTDSTSPTGGGVVLARTTVQRKSRLRVSASVLIDHSGTLVALPLINISLTGALISMGGVALPTLRVGLILLITVFAIENVQRQVDLVARVVRLGETEAALDWTEDRASAYDLARLLDELSAGRPV